MAEKTEQELSEGKKAPSNDINAVNQAIQQQG